MSCTRTAVTTPSQHRTATGIDRGHRLCCDPALRSRAARAPPPIGPGAFVGSACSPLAFGPESAGGFQDLVVWIFAGACLVLAAICGWRLLRAWMDTAAASARIAPLKADLDSALRKIRDFTDSQTRFVGNLAQEIQAPLATVVIHADLLLASSNEPDTVRRYAKSVAEDMRHLHDLVESCLRLAGPFAEEDTRNHVPVQFHDLVLEAVRRCQSLARTSGVSVVPMLAEAGKDSSIEVLGDAVLLESMIENLVRNAVLSSPIGTRVDLRVTVDGEQVGLSVHDRGAQIDADRLDSMFDGFFRAPASPRPTPGTGLSLAIAKRVAERHRGKISLRNLPEGGCEFEIRLPRWQAGPPPIGPHPAAAVPMTT